MAVRVSLPAVSAAGIGTTVPLNWQQGAPSAQVLVSFTNTPVGTYSVEYTLDRIDDAAAIAAAVWQPVSSLTAKTATADGLINFPCTAIRLNVTAYTTGNLVLKVLQADTK
jgi:hypothetical protein